MVNVYGKGQNEHSVSSYSVKEQLKKIPKIPCKKLSIPYCMGDGQCNNYKKPVEPVKDGVCPICKTYILQIPTSKIVDGWFEGIKLRG